MSNKYKKSVRKGEGRGRSKVPKKKEARKTILEQPLNKIHAPAGFSVNDSSAGLSWLA